MSTEQLQLPASTSKALSLRDQLVDKIKFFTDQEKKAKQAKELLQAKLDENDQIFMDLHKKHGDFEIGGHKVKLSASYKTVVFDESKLPAECFTIPTEKKISLTKVKELIIEGKIPASVAKQVKQEKVKFK